MRPATPALLLSAVLVLGTGAAHAVPGSLDPSFGRDGVARARVGAGGSAQALALQSDGKIVLAGWSWGDGSVAPFAVARLAADGSPDASFGNRGTTTTAFSTDAYAQAVALQPDGKVVVAGQAWYPSRFALARYRPDGSLDPSFGTGGKLELPLGESSSASAVATQPDGKIVVAGSAAVGPAGSGFALLRLEPDGSRDASFGTNGVAITTIGAYSAAMALALRPDGRIVAAGYSAPSSGFSQVAVARYGPDGSLDGSFGSGGTVTTAGSPYGAEARALALQPDGRIVVAGDDSGRGLALARFTRSGALDPTFGAGGKALTSLGWYSEAVGVALQPDGKIVAAGGAPIGAISGFAVARYGADGKPDPSFGREGVALTDLSSLPTVVGGTPSALALQPDGRIVVGGTVQTLTGGGPPTFGVARYLVTPGCRVPQVKRKRLAAAEAAIVHAGCSVGRIERAFSNRVARGRVILQRPLADAGLPEAGKVALLVSKGRRTH